MMLSSQPPPSQGPAVVPTSAVGSHHHLPTAAAALHRLPTAATASSLPSSLPPAPSQISYEGRLVSLLHANAGGAAGNGGMGPSAGWPSHSHAAQHFHPQFNSHHLNFGNFFAAGHHRQAFPAERAGPFHHIDEEERDTSPSSSGGSPRTDETVHGGGEDKSPPTIALTAAAAVTTPVQPPRQVQGGDIGGGAAGLKALVKTAS